MSSKFKIIFLFSFVFLIIINKADCQNNQLSRVVYGVPFLTLPPDARSGGLADVGAVSSPDTYSQYSNPAKYVFLEDKNSGVSFSYTPWLNNIINSIFFTNINYFNRINERSSWAASFTYFSIGEVDVRNDDGFRQYYLQPNEFAIDASYSLKLSQTFSMAVTGRFIRSDITDRRANPGFQAGNTFAVDLSGYYYGKIREGANFDSRHKIGFNISNIGPRISYSTTSDNSSDSYLPTNLKLGYGYDFLFKENNSLSLMIEANKLLVPEVGIATNGDFVQSNEGVISGIFSSFGDAEGGFSEELSQVGISLAAEYLIQNTFALRTGYHHEVPDVGLERKYASLGLGLNYKEFGFDVSYLLNFSDIQNPTQNSLRFSLNYSFN